jgi:hypothetical protein
VVSRLEFGDIISLCHSELSEALEEAETLIASCEVQIAPNGQHATHMLGEHIIEVNSRIGDFLNPYMYLVYLLSKWAGLKELTQESMTHFPPW